MIRGRLRGFSALDVLKSRSIKGRFNELISNGNLAHGGVYA
jgi:hypothetical protein